MQKILMLERLRNPLNIGEKVFVLAERLKKKHAPGRLYQSTTENRPYFNRNRIFTTNKCVLTSDNTYIIGSRKTSKKLKIDF